MTYPARVTAAVDQLLAALADLPYEAVEAMETAAQTNPDIYPPVRSVMLATAALARAAAE